MNQSTNQPPGITRAGLRQLSPISSSKQVLFTDTDSKKKAGHPEHTAPGTRLYIINYVRPTNFSQKASLKKRIA